MNHATPNLLSRNFDHDDHSLITSRCSLTTRIQLTKK